MEIEHIITLLARTYEKNAWHGPAVKEVLSGLTESQSFERLPHTHSIIELVAHMAAWRTYVTRKLAGDSAYKVDEQMNFPTPADWQETVDLLDASQRDLLAALGKFPQEKLHDQVAGKEQPLTYYTLLHGIIHHDLYHAGQIMLIRKARIPQPL